MDPRRTPCMFSCKVAVPFVSGAHDQTASVKGKELMLVMAAALVAALCCSSITSCDIVIDGVLATLANAAAVWSLPASSPRPGNDTAGKSKKRFARAVCSHPPVYMPSNISDFIDGLQHRTGSYFSRDTTALRTQEAIAWYAQLVICHYASCHHHTNPSRAEPSQPVQASSSTTGSQGARARSHSSSAGSLVETRYNDESRRDARTTEVVTAAQRPKGEGKAWGRVSPHSILSWGSSPATSCSGEEA